MNKHFRFSGSAFSKMEELGLSPSAVLRRAGLPQVYSKEPRVLLKTEELFALWRAIGELSDNPAIGLQLGTEAKTERFNPVGLAALSTENFGQAVKQMARCKQLTCPEEIVQHTDDKEWSIRFRWLLADEVEPPVLSNAHSPGCSRSLATAPARACRRCAWSSCNLGRMSEPLNVTLGAR